MTRDGQEAMKRRMVPHLILLSAFLLHIPEMDLKDKQYNYS
jgi:hypothetical protein